MPSFNRVTIVGNATRPPELRYTKNGKAVAEIGVAVNRKYKVGEETREDSLFLDVTAWGRTAEFASQYIGKGDPVFVDGRLAMDEWDDKNTGQRRTKIKVVAERVETFGRSETARASRPKQEPATAREDDGGDLPF